MKIFIEIKKTSGVLSGRSYLNRKNGFKRRQHEKIIRKIFSTLFDGTES